MESISRLFETFLLNALWQVALVSGVAAACACAMRNTPARYRHWLWMMALGLSLLLPLWSLRNFRWAHRRGPAQLEPQPGPQPRRARLGPPLQPGVGEGWIGPLEPVGQPHPGGFRLARYLRSRTFPVSLPPWLADLFAGCYLIFLLFRFARLWRAWRRTEGIRKAADARAIPDWLASISSECQGPLGLENVSILASSRVATPLTLGLRRRATIILPESLLRSVPAKDLTAALCHEMAHIRRHDFLVNIICELVYLPISFHPGAMLVKRRIDETRELCCDELVAGRVVAASSYARSLINIARSASSHSSLSRLGYTLGILDANNLEERIMRLLDIRPRTSAGLARTLLVGASLALAVSAALASASSLNVPTDPSSATLAANKESSVHPDFSGRWVMDKSKSHIDGMFPRSFTQMIEQGGSRLKITSEWEDWSENSAFYSGFLPLHIPVLLLTADNIERTQNSGQCEYKVKAYWEGSNLVTRLRFFGGEVEAGTGKMREGLNLESTWVRYLSEDGALQHLEITNRYPDGDASPSGNTQFVLAKSAWWQAPEGTEQQKSAGARKDGLGESPPKPAQANTQTALQAPSQDFVEQPRAPQEKISPSLSLQDMQKPQEQMRPSLEEIQKLQEQMRPSIEEIQKLMAEMRPSLEEFQKLQKQMHPSIEEMRKLQEQMRPSLDEIQKLQEQMRPSIEEIHKLMEQMRPSLEEFQKAKEQMRPYLREIRKLQEQMRPYLEGLQKLQSGQMDEQSPAEQAAKRAPSGLSGREPGAQRHEEVGSISGTVSDPSGARVPYAIVFLENEEIGLDKRLAADEAGEFSFKQLPPGQYRLEAKSPGFEVSRGIRIVLGPPGKTSGVLRVQLSPGSLIETVDVTAKAPTHLPASAPTSVPVRRIRVGGLVQAGRLLQRSEPKYPESARAEGIQGTVLLEAVISLEGVPLGMKVLSSPDSQLSRAAMDAVRQWRYQPTLLNGQPIEVVTTIAVRFRLEP